MVMLITIISVLWMCTDTSNAKLDFLVLGDWGGLPIWPYKTDIEDSTAKQMSITAKQTDSSFVIALGDNFYFHGVTNDLDVRFNETYTSVFNKASLHIPWYVVAGNHDHYGNVSAQVAYSQRSPLWKFPDLWHSHKWPIPGTNTTLKLVLIDTVVLCGNSGMDSEHVDSAQPQQPDNKYVARQQWQWLESQLKHSRDDYLIVGGHFPVWSIAEHGPTKCLVERLKPLLEQYRVSMYMCGHDHNLQHLHEDGSPVEYFVVGSANFIEHSKKHRHAVPHNSSKFYWADASRKGGFAHVRVTAKHMKLTLIDSLGGSLYKVVMKPRFQ